MKFFYGGTYIEKEELKQNQIFYPIRLEYYKIKHSETQSTGYGIEVIKTEYQNEKRKVENKVIEEITSDEKEIESILDKLKQGTVTPIGVEDIVKELSGSLSSI